MLLATATPGLWIALGLLILMLAIVTCLEKVQSKVDDDGEPMRQGVTYQIRKVNSLEDVNQVGVDLKNALITPFWQDKWSKGMFELYTVHVNGELNSTFGIKPDKSIVSFVAFANSQPSPDVSEVVTKYIANMSNY